MSNSNNLEHPILNKVLEKVKMKVNTTSESGIGLSPDNLNKKTPTESPLTTNNIKEPGH